MTNRLRKLLRTFSCCVGLFISLSFTTLLNAQAGFFTFTPNGPDSLLVGPNCNLALQGNILNPTVTSTIGATITMSMFDDVSSGFPFNDPFTAGDVAHIYWFVKDNMGHSHSFEFFIRFVDRTPPVFNLTGIGDTLYFASIVQVPAAPNIPVLDNCTAVTTTFMETPRPDTCLAGQFKRTWKATDTWGNTTTFTQTIIIAADVTPPTITFPPQNGSSPCHLLATSYPAWLAAQMAAFTVQDPSGIKSKTNNGPASYPPGCKVPITVTFKATDNCNLMIATTAVFTTSDTKGPVVVVAPKDTVAYCSPGGNHLTKLNEWINKRAFLQVYDSCSAPISYSMKMNNILVDSSTIVAAFWASFDNPCGQQNVGGHLVDKVSAFVKVNFFAKDACGNETSAGMATYAAVDTLPPVITGVNITEQCGGGNDQTALQNWINAKGNATLADDCSIAFWTSYTFTTSSGQSGSGTFNNGPYPTIVANNCTWFTDVTFLASDECDNANAKTLRFEIIDTQPPVFTGLAPNITVYCPDPLPTVPAATITDNCDASITISFTRVNIEYLCTGSYTARTIWQATDDCGNTDTITQNIFVRDTTRPVFTLVPVGLIMRCDTFVLPPVPVQGTDIDATDICSQVVSIATITTSSQNPNPALCGHYSYNITRTFTATDECGNTKTATQLISVIDNQPPVPGGVLDTTALCSALLPFPAPVPLAVDFCSGPTQPPVYVDTETTPGGCAGQYTLTLNWIATDVCGNQAPFEQIVHVVDTLAPTLSNIPSNITVECNAIPAAPNTASFNGADNCAPNVAVSLLETEIRNPNLTSCDHWTNYTVRREWMATDDCGNAWKYTQNIQVVDTTPPVLIAPAAITLPTDMGICGTSIPIPEPLSVFDLCTAGTTTVLLKDTLPILPIPNGMNNSQPVDTIVFHFSTPNLPPSQPAISNVSLSIFLDQADTDASTEYFTVYGESGPPLGITSNTTMPCTVVPSISTTVFSIPADVFNAWTGDGELVITLVPNLVGGNPINPTCPNSRVRMRVGYTYSTPHVPVNLTYSLDGGTPASFPPPGPASLGIGAHTVVYTATDCVGNSSTASVQIQVNDTQPPSITAPAPIIAYIGPGVCSTSVKLPFPAITENCQMSGHLMKSSTFVPLTFYTHPDAGIIPVSATMPMSGLIPNAIANGTLTIKFKGENGRPREFFNIFNGSPPQLTTTNIGSESGRCTDTVLTSIPISAATINAWAATGNTVFTAVANTDGGPLFLNDFINPCDSMLLPDGTDGKSVIQAMLQYDYAIVNFKITRNSPSMIVATGAVQGTQTMVTLPPGDYTVEYKTIDNAGLMGITTFPLTIRDTIRPVAKCKPSLIIKVNPSGVNNYMLQPSEINNGSTDNCSALTYSLSQTSFSCNQAGNNFVVTLTVRDTSGNTSTCATVVKVENFAPMPTADPVCEGDTLQLYANPPIPGSFSYQWTGPTFATTIQNPTRFNAILDYQGLYTVAITGATGCTASGSVTVNFANLAVPFITVPSGVNFCQGQNVILNAIPFAGPNVSYQWYQDAPTPILLGTTTDPFFTIIQPTPGQYNYYVRVKLGECFTPNSLIITINVFARPLALVGYDTIIVCAGEQLALITPVFGPGLTYKWSGPTGDFTVQNPLVSNAATLAHSGIYTLTTSQNGCESIPSDTTLVIVKYTPPVPQILGMQLVCVGDSVTLVASGAGMPSPSLFEWQDPLMSVTTTTTDKLKLPSATVAHCGNWRVRAKSADGCFSAWSAPFYFCPQPYPIVTAMALNSMICKDSTLKLNATTNSMLPLTWCWTLPDATQNCQQNLTLNPGLPGIYQVTGTTSNGCAGTSSVTILVSQAPIIDSIQNTAPVCALETTVICLNPFFSSSSSPFTYNWTKGGSSVSTNASHCFPGIPGNNGTYTFVVKDKFGCPSAPASVMVNVLPVVPTPTLAISPNPVCAGSKVTLSCGLATGSPQYHWIDPQGLMTVTSGPQLELPGILVAQSGNYQVFVTQGVCQSQPSNTESLVVNAIPPTPVPTSNQPICRGADLQLDATNIPGATYTWTGPSGFSSMLVNPPRPNATLAYEGTYSVSVKVDGCMSDFGTVFVDVMQLPDTPSIATPLPLCLEQFPLSGQLNITQGSQTFTALYTWLSPGTDTIAGPSTITTLKYADLPPALLTPGEHLFQVVAWLPDPNNPGRGCSSPKFAPIKINFDTIPDNVALAEPNHTVCVTNANPVIHLNAAAPSGNITGKWKEVGTPTVSIANPDLASTQFEGLAQHVYTFTWKLSNGGCKDFSTDTLVITAVPPEVANAGPDQRICVGSNVSLSALQGQYSSGTWSQMGQIGVMFADSTEPMTPIMGLNPGNRYFFDWTLDDIGCGASTDRMSVSYHSVKPIITGNDFVCTIQDCTPLNSQDLQSWESGKWTSKTNNLTFSQPNNPSTTVCGLVPGINVIYWTINDGFCGDNSRDTFEVVYEIFPQAFNDLVAVPFGTAANFKVLTNDILPTDPPTVTIIVPPGNGTLTNLANGMFTYRPFSGFTGTDAMVYKICNSRCEDGMACSNATVTFSVAGPGECEPPTVITPNGDGFNDGFKIPASCYIFGEGQGDVADLTIFNQWGDFVYHNPKFLATDEWDGKYNGEYLPASTYYYVVKFEGGAKPLSGFLILQR